MTVCAGVGETAAHVTFSRNTGWISGFLGEEYKQQQTRLQYF